MQARAQTGRRRGRSCRQGRKQAGGGGGHAGKGVDRQAEGEVMQARAQTGRRRGRSCRRMFASGQCVDVPDMAAKGLARHAFRCKRSRINGCSRRMCDRLMILCCLAS
eukprot:354138-Chlamydomonas_euryale.AAC.1